MAGRVYAECAHIGFSTSRRGLAQKFPDRETIPLCAHHHKNGASAVHKIGVVEFFRQLDIDRDQLLSVLNDAYDAVERGRP
jgi:hypothetical protein